MLKFKFFSLFIRLVFLRYSLMVLEFGVSEFLIYGLWVKLCVLVF